jgi:CHAD domain-containing protein
LNEIVRQTHRLRRALRAVQVRVTDERVHELRVRLKRLHWYARVLRPFTPDDRRPFLRKRVSGSLFHLGGHVRDAAIMDALVATTAERTVVSVEVLREQLQREQRIASDMLRQTLVDHDDTMLLELITLVEHLAMSVSHDELRARLAAMVQRRLTRCARLVRDLREPEQAHTLRKRLKEITYALDIDALAGGAQGRALRERLHEAEEVLGTMHDIDVLRERLPAFTRGGVLPRGVRTRLDDALRRERKRLRTSATELLEVLT